MNKHGKKMIAPIVVTTITVLYYIAYFGFIMASLNWLGNLVLGLLPLLLSAIMIAVCIERIKEIKKGEEDDLSKY